MPQVFNQLLVAVNIDVKIHIIYLIYK